MKQFIKEIPPITRCITITSILLYLITILFFAFDINLIKVFGLYSIESDNFNIYQIVTYSFIHTIDPHHILWNIANILIYGTICEKLIKRNSFIILILFTIILNTIVINFVFIRETQHCLGLSTIGFSLSVIFILIKNDLNKILNFSLKLIAIIMIIDELLVIMTTTNNIESIIHITGVISAIIFYICYFLHKKRKSIKLPFLRYM
jgi:membrane associated rhomboid family serine protease